MKPEKDFFGRKTGSVGVFCVCTAIFLIGLIMCVQAQENAPIFQKPNLDVPIGMLLAVLAYGIINLLRFWDHRKGVR